KRKIIGRDFVEVFNEEAIRIEDVRWLAQGTIYPDVSGGGIPSVYTVESVTELKGIKYGTDKGTQGTQQGRWFSLSSTWYSGQEM
ncbi:hypothetical protein NE555_17175, partial [Alistipes onderdonkii]|nr:hypothetical protein [Alistipes onderdonkii]